MRLDSGTCIIRDGGNEVRRVPIPVNDSQPKNFYIKKYFTSSRSKFWKGFWRGTYFGKTKVRREFRNLNRIRRIGLDAPKPLAFGEERHMGCLLNSFLVTEEVAEPVGLDHFLTRNLPNLEQEKARIIRRTLLENLARATRDLHNNGFEHCDLFWRNIILSKKCLDRFYLIDAPKGRCWPIALKDTYSIRDLAMLDTAAPLVFRKTERMLFYKHYHKIEHLTESDKKRIHRILMRAEPMREKQIRRLHLQ